MTRDTARTLAIAAARAAMDVVASKARRAGLGDDQALDLGGAAFKAVLHQANAAWSSRQGRAATTTSPERDVLDILAEKYGEALSTSR